MTEVRYPEWIDQFELTNYPFEDHATLLSRSGKRLPASVFVDARLNLIVGNHGVYLSSIIVEPKQVTLWLGDPSNSKIAYSEFDIGTSSELVKFLDTAGRHVGVMMTRPGALSLFRAWGVGVYDFDLQATRLVGATYIVLPSTNVNGFVLDDGTIVSGNVVFVGGPGVVLEVNELYISDGCGNQTPTGASGISVNVVGDPLFKRRLCEPEELFASPNFIKQLCFTVPGRTGDPNYPDKAAEIVCCNPGDLGDVQISAGQNDSDTSIVRVRVTDSGILIEAIGERI